MHGKDEFNPQLAAFSACGLRDFFGAGGILTYLLSLGLAFHSRLVHLLTRFHWTEQTGGFHSVGEKKECSCLAPNSKY